MHRTKLLVGVLLLALVAALVAVALLWRDRSDEPATEPATMQRAEDAAEEVAREVITEMTTYSYRTVEEDFAWVESAGTEHFQERFAGAMKETVRAIRRLKAEATGQVVDSAATAVDEDHVKVLLFVDQEITSRNQEGSKLDQPRVTMQLVRTDGEWLVDEVQIRNLITQ